MPKVPNSKPRISREHLILALIDQGLWSNDRVTRLSVVGVRGYYFNSMGRPRKNDRGLWDDAIFILTPDDFLAFNGNTDPSRQYKHGLAQAVAPQAWKYKPGYHGYRSKWGHRAFRQFSNVTVTRDGRDGTFTDKPSSRFWINLHRGGYRTTSSAGCQTLPPNQWDAFYSTMRMLLKRWNGPSEVFTYNLIEGPLT